MRMVYFEQEDILHIMATARPETQSIVWIVHVEARGHCNLLLTFNTGERKLVNIEQYLRGPVFRPVREDPGYFNLVQVDNELGTIVWLNGADIDPDVLYGSHVPAWMEAELTVAV